MEFLDLLPFYGSEKKKLHRYNSRMARIVIWTWDEPGHINPALALAKRLSVRGHSVVFIGGSVARGLIEAHNFPVHVPPFDAYSGPFPPHADMQEVVETVQRFDADLILCDVIRTFEAVVALSAGIKCALYSTGLPIWSDPIGPPVYSAISEPKSQIARWIIGAAWKANLVRQWANRWKYWKKYPGYRKVNRFFGHACAELGMSDDEVNWNTLTVVPLPFLPKLPTLIMCPSVLDFPRLDSGRMHWIEPSILRDRPGAITFREDDHTKPLVYVSLGTQVYRVPWAEKWFETACGVFARRPDWQGVISVGDVLAPKLSHLAIPGRLEIVPTTAQHLVLEKTVVAVIHGGLNSVKECIMAGVPMAIFPTGHDQPGNAVRVRARGLGIVGCPESMRSEKFEAIISELLENPVYRKNVECMRRLFEQAEYDDHGVKVIERVLAGSS